MLAITFTKQSNVTISLHIRRADGSETWYSPKPAQADFFIHHDLAHYIVETTMGYREGFYGLVGTGINITDFADRDVTKSEKFKAPVEALHTELIVGQLLLEHMQQSAKLTYMEFMQLLAQACNERHLPIPKLAEDQLDAMRRSLQQLYQSWAAVPMGGRLSLQFPIT